MKTKKYLIALAIFGGVFFTAQATNIIDLNDQMKQELTREKSKFQDKNNKSI